MEEGGRRTEDGGGRRGRGRARRDAEGRKGAWWFGGGLGFYYDEVKPFFVGAVGAGVCGDPEGFYF